MRAATGFEFSRKEGATSYGSTANTSNVGISGAWRTAIRAGGRRASAALVWVEAMGDAAGFAVITRRKCFRPGYLSARSKFGGGLPY